MNVKYKKYIDYIVKDIELPYLKSLNMYEIKQDDYHLVLSKLFNEPVDYDHGVCIDKRLNNIYNENSDGDWEKYQYDTNGQNEIYREDRDGNWSDLNYIADTQYGVNNRRGNILVGGNDISGYDGKTVITHTERLKRENDSLRTIRILKPNVAGQVHSEFQRLLRQ